MKFSERIGVTQPPALQVGSMSPELRTSLWNFIYTNVIDKDDKWQKKFNFLYMTHFKWRVDELTYWHVDIQNIKSCFFSDQAEWNQIYDLVDFIATHQWYFNPLENRPRNFCKAFNVILERENSGYRFVAEQLAPITNQDEMEAVQNAASIGNQQLASVSAHIKTAISLLSKKPDPDYRNSIKESISAVESAAKLISGEDGGGLKDALDKLKKHFPIHGAMRDGFLKLYGWTSDDGGIRHGLLDEPSVVGFDEAKYMLVSCSAFVNYLVAKANEAKII